MSWFDTIAEDIRITEYNSAKSRLIRAGWPKLAENKLHEINVLGRNREELGWIDDKFIDDFPNRVQFLYRCDGDLYSDEGITIHASLYNGYYISYNARCSRDKDFKDYGIVYIHANKYYNELFKKANE